MNILRLEAKHKVFETYSFEKIVFKYDNIQINIELSDKKLIIILCGRKSINKIKNVLFKLYDLVFLILGSFPLIESVFINDKKIDISDWVRKFKTSMHFVEKEAMLCEISSKIINAEALDRMGCINRNVLSSMEYIVSEYYEHMVSNHRIELMTHTIDGFLRHTNQYDALLKELKNKNSKKNRIDYIESVERVFRIFFFYHRKNNAQILQCVHIKNKCEFLQIISDTRNDFTHFLENKEHRLIKGRDMVYFIDLIFLANRLFILKEILYLPIMDEQVEEYMYILHDWIDEIVNGRSDRIKSKRYRQLVRIKEANDFYKEIYNEFAK